MKSKDRKRHLNNGGFSLLELIVVIAIMVVLVGAVFASTSIIDGSYVKDAERGVKDYVATGRTKSMSIAAKEWYVTIVKEGDTYFARLNKTEEVEGSITEVLIDERELGSKITITFGKDHPTEVTSANELKMYFNSSTGKVNKVTINDADQDISEGIGYMGISSGTYDITMKIFYNTGKCERE